METFPKRSYTMLVPDFLLVFPQAGKQMSISFWKPGEACVLYFCL